MCLSSFWFHSLLFELVDICTVRINYSAKKTLHTCIFNPWAETGNEDICCCRITSHPIISAAVSEQINRHHAESWHPVWQGIFLLPLQVINLEVRCLPAALLSVFSRWETQNPNVLQLLTKLQPFKTPLKIFNNFNPVYRCILKNHRILNRASLVWFT